MFKSIINWWKGQFGDGSVTYQEDDSVKKTQVKFYEFPDGTKFEEISCHGGYYVRTNNGLRLQQIKGFPYFDKWEPPMIELFLLCVKDRKGWEFSKDILTLGGQAIHEELKIFLYKKPVFSNGVDFTYTAKGITLTSIQIQEVFYALELYLCTDKFNRLRNISLIRKQKLDKLNRENEAKRIREYLEGK